MKMILIHVGGKRRKLSRLFLLRLKMKSERKKSIFRLTKDRIHALGVCLALGSEFKWTQSPLL